MGNCCGPREKVIYIQTSYQQAAKAGFKKGQKPMPSLSVEAILKQGTQEGLSKYKSNKMPLKAQAFDITQNGNILFYQQGRLGIWSLLEDKEFLSVESKAVTVIKAMGVSGALVVGFSDGTVEMRGRTLDLLFALELSGEVTDIAAKESEFFVALNNGRIFKVDPETQGKIELKGQEEEVDNQQIRVSESSAFIFALQPRRKTLEVVNVKKRSTWQCKLPVLEAQIEDHLLWNVIFWLEQKNAVYALGANGKGVDRYMLTTGKKTDSVELIPDSMLTGVVSDREGQIVCAMGQDNAIRVWDMAQGVLRSTLLDHLDRVLSLAFPSSGTHLISAAKDRCINVWDLSNYTLLISVRTDSFINQLLLTPQEDFIFGLSQSQSQDFDFIEFIAYKDTKQAFRLNGGDFDNVLCSFATPDFKYLGIINGKESMVEVWDLRAREMVEQFTLEASFWLGIRTINGTADSGSIFFQTEVGRVVHWDTKQRKEVHSFDHEGNLLLDLAVTSDGQHLLCSSEPMLYRWNLKTRALDWKIKHPEANYIYMALTPDDSKVLSNAYGPYIFETLVKGDEKQEMNKFDIIKDSGWVLFELSLDGNTLIQTNQYNGSFWVVNLKEQKVDKILQENQRTINFIAFTPDAKYFVTRSEVDTIIWELSSWTAVANIPAQICIATSCDRHCISLVINGLFYVWNEQTLSDLKQAYPTNV